MEGTKIEEKGKKGERIEKREIGGEGVTRPSWIG